MTNTERRNAIDENLRNLHAGDNVGESRRNLRTLGHTGGLRGLTLPRGTKVRIIRTGRVRTIRTVVRVTKNRVWYMVAAGGGMGSDVYAPSMFETVS